MARNMIEANKYIFRVLDNFIQSSEANLSIAIENKRCIETNDIEKKWLKNLQIIEIQPILSNFKIASFNFESKKYFVTVGWYNRDFSDEIIELIETNAGIFTAIISELKVPIIHQTNPYEIVEEIFYPSDETIIKYNYSLIAKFFEPISIYQIIEESPSPFINEGDINLIRLSGFYILKNRQLICLKFFPLTLSKFEKIFVEGAKNLPYENLLFSLVSISWRHSFLDIYRCIERLFCISFLEEFHKNLKIELSLLKLSSDLENYLNWKPKENEALSKIINNSPQDAINLLKEIKLFIDGKEENCSDIIYKLRNSIVHFRPATEEIKLDEANWDKLIYSCLLVIDHWYSKYDEQLKL